MEKSKLIEARNHFLLIKQPGFSSDGIYLSALNSAELLLRSNIWPLWEKTRCRHMIKKNSLLLVYLAGNETHSKTIIASATVLFIETWSTQKHSHSYPLLLEGTPACVLNLENVHFFSKPIDFLSKLEELSFIPANKKKWGVALMGGVRSLSRSDYQLLTKLY